MDKYWNERFIIEGKIWGDIPNKAAYFADMFYKRFGVQKILILGAGYGRNAAYFKSCGYDVTGIEQSPEGYALSMVENPGVNIIRASIFNLPVVLKDFDAVFCHNLIHFFKSEKRKSLIKKCSKVLKNHGYMFFTFYSDMEPSYGIGVEIEPNTFENKPGRPVHYYSEEDMIKQFHEFKIIESGMIDDPEDHGEGFHIHKLRYLFVEK